MRAVWSWLLIAILATALIALLSPFAKGLFFGALASPYVLVAWKLSPPLVIGGFFGLLFMLVPFVVVGLIFHETYRSLCAHHNHPSQSL